MHGNTSCANHWIDNRVFLNRIVLCQGIVINRENADSSGVNRSYNSIPFDSDSKTKVNFDLEIFNQIVTDENVLAWNTSSTKNPRVPVISSHRLFITVKKVGFCNGDSFGVIKTKSSIGS